MNIQNSLCVGIKPGQIWDLSFIHQYTLFLGEKRRKNQVREDQKRKKKKKKQRGKKNYTQNIVDYSLGGG